MQEARYLAQKRLLYYARRRRVRRRGGLEGLGGGRRVLMIFDRMDLRYNNQYSIFFICKGRELWSAGSQYVANRWFFCMLA